ncbi:MAG: mechanosensitive ion channel family protein [Deltaproteobacteria bacterium]|nr:mechanosensitive ion channel family protein [Deltaproteobacteria bacterium]
MDVRFRLIFLAFALCLIGQSVTEAQPPPVDCSTPQKAARTFLDNLQDDEMHPEDAIRCFDWEGGGVQGRRAKIEAARHLQAVLDQRGLYIDMESIPDTADVADEEMDDGKIPLARRLPEIHLVKIEDEWLISSRSVHAIEGLYDETFTYDVQGFVDELPEWTRYEPLPGLAIWQLLGLFIAFLGGMLMRFLVARVLFSWVRRLLKKRKMKFDFDVLQRAANPIGTLAMTAFLWWTIPLLRFSVRVNQVATIALRVMAAAAAVLLVYRLVDFGADIFARRAEKTETKLDDQVVPLIRKTLKVFVVAVGLIFVLQNLDVDVGSLLAGVSLGGLAFTLAARDTVANLFGSISVFADQPFQVGDWVVIEGHEGVVEEVGMRSTRIRTFYDSVIAIPNSVVANAAVDNYGRRRYRRCLVTLGLTYATTPEQMQAFVEGVRGILKANPKVRQDSYEVHFKDFGDSALEVMLYFFFEVESYSDEMKQRQNVFLEVMRLADAIGVSFAFPTQTLHLETRAKETEMPEHPRPPKGELAKIAAAFGPGGDRSQPDTPMLTNGFLAGAMIRKGSDEEADADADG